MKIIKFQGGLGNQMFQYALYKTLITVDEVCADLSIYKDYFRPYMLKDAFDIELINHDKYYIKKYSNHIFTRAINKLLLTPLKLQIISIRNNYYIESPEIKSDYYLSRREGYFDGYWQSEKYFIASKEEIMRDFNFIIRDKNVIRLANLIQTTTPNTSLHWRRGDYVNNRDHDVLTTKYFREALLNLIENKGIKYVFIFSEDFDWVEAKIKTFNLNVTIIVISKEVNGVKDHNEMYLMTLCENNIISNSSYSWWGAYLNKKHEKTVIAPSRWSTKLNFDLMEIDRVPLEWLRLSL